IAQEEEARFQSTQKEFKFMAVANAYEEIKRVKVNCTLEGTLQQASTFGTQSDNALVYDSDGSTEIAQEEEARFQSTQKEFKFMAVANAYEEIKRVKVNCTLEGTLQQASTFGTQSDNALVYDSDGSTEHRLRVMVMVSMIAQEEEARFQSTQKKFKFMAVANAYEEIKRVKVNCTLEGTLQQASTSGTQSDNAPVYDSDGSTEEETLELAQKNRLKM
nr:hypothetical protein [Tanacetum cinerariifolium]